MAADPNHDEDTDETDDESVAPSGHSSGTESPLARKRRKSLPSVESSLDAFIARANEKLLDVSAFNPETREQALQREIERLQTKLEKAQAQAAEAKGQAAEARAALDVPTIQPKRWPGMLAAFVVGAGAMFAVSLALPKTEEAKPAAISEPTPPPVQPSQPTVTPLPEPAATATTEPAKPTPEPAVETPPTPAVAATPDKPDKAAAKTAANVAAKKKRTTPTTPTTPPTKPATDTPPPKPPEKTAGSGSDSELYNPF